MQNSVRPNQAGKFPHVVPRSIGAWYGNVALGNGTAYQIGCFEVLGGVFVGVQDRGAYVFMGYAHWAYVKEKIGLAYESDARNLADFINDQMSISNSRQGTYSDNLTTRERL